MKKLCLYLIPIGYAFFTALATVCSLDIIALSMSPFGNLGEYPRFIPFCAVAVLLSLVVLGLLFVLNLRILDGSKKIKKTLVIETSEVIVFFFVFMTLIPRVLDILQKIL